MSNNNADVQLLHLREHSVMDLDAQFMPAWPAKTSQSVSQIISDDELSIRKGFTHRIVVSNLER